MPGAGKVRAWGTNASGRAAFTRGEACRRYPALCRTTGLVFHRPRRVVQAAACVGRPFTSDFLAALLEDGSAQVIEPLKALVDAEIFRTRQYGTARRYEFRHSLLQRMAYDSMVETERRSIHGRIVDLLKSSANKRPVLPEVIAHHSTAAARFQDATSAWFEAAASAPRRSAHLEALQHLRIPLPLLREISDPELRRQMELNFLAAQIG